MNRVKNFETKRNRQTFEIKFYVNDQHYVKKRRFKRQIMNQVNQNDQLFQKSFFNNK
jgi:hypothetical protein